MNLPVLLAFRQTVKGKLTALVAVFSIAAGCATVIAIGSYKSGFEEAIRKEAGKLLGADVMLESNSAYTETQRRMINNRIPRNSELEEAVVFSSMILHPNTKALSLATIRAVGKKFPLYGEVLTDGRKISNLGKREILLDKGLSDRLGVGIGESVRVGYAEFILAGYILEEPPLTGSFFSMAPSAYIRLEDFSDTRLEQRGSRLRYMIFSRFKDEANVKSFKDREFDSFINQGITIHNKEEAGTGSRRFISTTLDYLQILGYASLLLGLISVVITVRSRLSDRAEEIGVMKCLGADWKIYGKMFLFEIFLLSLAGSILGIAGAYILFNFISSSASFFGNLPGGAPFSITSLISGLGLAIFLPLILGFEAVLRIRKLNASETFQELSPEENTLIGKLLKLAAGAVTVFLLFIFLPLLSGNPLKAYLPIFAWLVLPILLYLVYFGMRMIAGALLKIIHSNGIVYLTLRRIHHPLSGTALKIAGAGTALSVVLSTILFSNTLFLIGGGNQAEKRANLFILDIRKEQIDRFNSILRGYPISLRITAPVTGARLSRINGKPVAREKTERDALKRDWKATARIREYFLSYRDSLYSDESVVSGTFWKNPSENEISIEKEFAEVLGVKTGDTLSFNVQGIEVEGTITNTRNVNWADMKPNFVVLFSSNALKDAPGYFITSFRVEESGLREELSSVIAHQFPNVTIVDVSRMTSLFVALFKKIASILDIMTVTIILSGVLLLISSLSAGRRRVRNELGLYQNLGASKNQILMILATEGCFNGLYIFISSSIITLGINYFLCEKFLNIPFQIPIVPFLVTGMVSVIGCILLFIINGLFLKDSD